MEIAGLPIRRRAGRGAAIVVVVLASVVITACSEATPAECPELPRIDVSGMDPADDSMPLRYPMDIVENLGHEAGFSQYRGDPDGKFHAAEDFWRPAGTGVYAMADGEVSFSGRMGGYGWLVIVDHPEMNIYSLYGHLSPSRWKAAAGPVSKGDLVGYLGDEWENGGSRDKPLVTHLHLGVRTGQRTDYAGRGEWRWMAGWIGPCPGDLGWLQPSAVITAQTVPRGGWDGPAGNWLQRMWVEILIVGIMLIAPIVAVGKSIRRQMVVLPLLVALVLVALARYLAYRGFVLIWPVYAMAAMSLLTGIAVVGVRRSGAGKRS